MKNELRILKCNKCGALVEELIPCNCGDCGIKCCNETMGLLVANEADGAKEKHVPVYEIVEDEVFVKVGEVAHPMTKEHYIMWIAMVTDNKIEKIMLYPEQEASVRFKYVPGSRVYAYCNLHGLYATDIK